jgi:hypothetical protein
MWAPFTHEFVFPSDPIIWMFWGRWIATNKHWALFIRDVTKGFIMTQSFGFHYWLSFLFSCDLSSSFDIMRFSGPTFGTFTLFSVYELVRKISKSKLTAIFSLIVLETYHLWIWAQRITTEYTVIGFMLPLSILLSYEYFEYGKRFQDLCLLFTITGGLWLYHPPTSILFILPTFLCYILKWRRKIPLYHVIKGALIFLTITSPYFMLLNSNSVYERLKGFDTIKEKSDFLFYEISYEILMQNIFYPFRESLGLYSIIPFVFLIVSIVYGLYKFHDDYSADALAFQIILIMFLLEYLYWILPLSNLRIALSQVYPVDRMLLHLALPISVLYALGCNILLNFLTKNSFSLNFKIINLNFRIRIYCKIILIIFLFCIFSLQVFWGFSKIDEYSKFYPYQMTNSGAKMIRWIDMNTPLNSTILIDEPTTSDYQTISPYGTHGYIRNIISRGDGWLAFAALYPRDVIGDPKIFEEAEKSCGEGFIDFCKKYNVKYVMMTNPNKYPILALSLNKSLIHREDDVLLFSLPAAYNFTGPLVLLFQDVGWKDDGLMEGWSKEGPDILSDGSIATLVFSNSYNFTIWARTNKHISPPLNTSENGYRYFIIRLFIEEENIGDYIAIFMRDIEKGDQLMGVFENLPKGC